MTVWCVENLHRLPQEIRLPHSVLIAAMIAHGVVSAERQEKLEADLERARRSW